MAILPSLEPIATLATKEQGRNNNIDGFISVGHRGKPVSFISAALPPLSTGNRFGSIDVDNPDSESGLKLVSPNLIKWKSLVYHHLLKGLHFFYQVMLKNA